MSNTPPLEERLDNIEQVLALLVAKFNPVQTPIVPPQIEAKTLLEWSATFGPLAYKGAYGQKFSPFFLMSIGQLCTAINQHYPGFPCPGRVTIGLENISLHWDDILFSLTVSSGGKYTWSYSAPDGTLFSEDGVSTGSIFSDDFNIALSEIMEARQ